METTYYRDVLSEMGEGVVRTSVIHTAPACTSILDSESDDETKEVKITPRNSAEEQWLPFGESWRNEQLRLSLERGSSNLLVSCCNQFEISLRSPQGRGFLLCSCMSFPRCNTEYLKQCSLCRTLYCTKHQKRGSAKEVRRTSNNHPPPLCLQRRFYINMWWCRNSPDSS
ncbi:unnamed protein product [Heligmosomoides polygyrus]|uniref:AN1-type domain-containing protein n=1 Tax=Heligmosomoides polygyrus TaxID=6339 RepID=A0A183GB46_HELPZ|nr:unnamed protein product [Heligmosomoides polygyrus]